MTEIGARVVAVLSAHGGVVNVMGEGEYLGPQVPGPDVPGGEFFRELNIPNPAIKLDNGVVVYGFECWWGEKTMVEKKFKGMKWEVVPVAVYRPVKSDTVEGPDGKQIPSL